MISLLSDHIGVNPGSIWLERFYPLNEARTMVALQISGGIKWNKDKTEDVKRCIC